MLIYIVPNPIPAIFDALFKLPTYKTLITSTINSQIKVITAGIPNINDKYQILNLIVRVLLNDKMREAMFLSYNYSSLISLWLVIFALKLNNLKLNYIF